MFSLSMFGFKAMWSPYFFIFTLLILSGYFLITVFWRNKFKNSEQLTVRQGVFFTTAVILLYIIKGSPIDLMAHLMFFAHMIQMAFLYLVIPPLLIKGIPQWIWRNVLEIQGIRRVFRFFTKPIIALISFNGMLSFYHVPFIFDFIKTNIWIHAIFTIILLIASLFMWWPLVNEVEKYGKLQGLKKIGYIFADGMLLTPACALIIFADQPLYSTYSDPSMWLTALELCVSPGTLANLNLSGPEMFTSLSLLHDQQLGGVLMKILQEIIYGIVLFHVFFEWYRKEEQDSKEELKKLEPSIIEGN